MSSHFLFAYFIAYSGIVFWMMTSPDIRFGYPYLLMSLLFPLGSILSTNDKYETVKNGNFHKSVIAISIVGCMYYGTIAINFLKPYSIKAGVLRPFKSIEYEKNNELKSFQYVMLANNIKLYIHDSLHHSINAPLPSCSPYRREIRMRGNKLKDGFKTQP